MDVSKILQKFISSPKYLTNGAGFLSKKWGVSKEEIYEARSQAREILYGEVKKQVDTIETVVGDLSEKVVQLEENFKDKTAVLSYKGPKEVKTKEDLIRECNIDLSQWEITKMVQNAWGKEGNQNYQVKAWLAPIKAETVFNGEFREFLKDYTPAPKVLRIEPKNNKGRVCLVFPKQDAHFNKYDVGNENNILKRFEDDKRTVVNMLSKAVVNNHLEEVLYVVGSDSINSEFTSATTKGTPQVNILSYQEAFRAICDHEVDIITSLLSYSDRVKILFVPGNHDQYVGWHLIDWLEGYFRLQGDRLSFDSLIDNTKYHRYHNAAIMFNHGDAIKPAALAQKFPIGFKKEWSLCDFYFVFTGDKHTELSKDFGGIKFYQVPQLSNAKSGWDLKNGYDSSKAEATAFVITSDNGMSDIYKEII